MDISKIVDRLDFRKLCLKYGIGDQRDLDKFVCSVSEIEKSNHLLQQQIERLNGDKWIRVEDRLPEDKSYVFIYTEDYCYSMACWCG